MHIYELNRNRSPLKFVKSSRVRCQGLLKIFRAPIHTCRAHRAVIFAIAQLSCTSYCIPVSSSKQQYDGRPINTYVTKRQHCVHLDIRFVANLIFWMPAVSFIMMTSPLWCIRPIGYMATLPLKASRKFIRFHQTKGLSSSAIHTEMHPVYGDMCFTRPATRI